MPFDSVRLCANACGGIILVMAEAFEDVYRVKGLDEVTRELRELRDATRGAGDEARGMSRDWGGLSGRITAASTGFTAATQAISLAVSAAQAFSESMRVTTGVLDAQAISVDEASRRLGGLVSELDLIRISNLAMQTGLDLSEEQFADLSVAAVEAA
ncbi:MAG: hypothetical protein AAGI01_16715, partial [Myxococcota bacterium]